MTSTILKFSKEDKSSSSSQHSVGVATLSTTTDRPPPGGSSTLPAVQEEPDHDDGGVSTATPAPQEQLQEHGEGCMLQLVAKQAALAVACKDPFSEDVRCTILNSWQPQKSDQEQLLESSGKRPVLKAGTQITLDGRAEGNSKTSASWENYTCGELRRQLKEAFLGASVSERLAKTCHELWLSASKDAICVCLCSLHVLVMIIEPCHTGDDLGSLA
ncbi:hypothetical protein HPB49_003056 [Dermacentor silvarum]|uniref:Uncharacterized protein n=1 Tax=Dermacentor silvarum TaxID=543639 RepID=A0ACB8DSZ5_DERSI|nr:hypothetical protein HPB49_003056 [Dermacentor silvarum]